ncbi:MAG TPA: hypothetical protein VK879_00870, partial [Candidatus Sulfomarinibacteraceae bacterium]|nr:hypothetical protein [Candidatus Sulfomarinibacteraceae bacterium]
ELFWFHLPLASTAVLTLLAQPLVAVSLARLDNPTLSLAAWPLVFQLTLLSRAAAMALPEAVIALTEGPDTHAPVRRFSLTLAAVSTVGMVLFVFSPLLPFYLVQIQDTHLDVASLAAYGTRLFLFYPAFFVLVSWLRGILINDRETGVVNAGMAINLTVTAVVLFLGVAVRLTGILTAALALNAAIVAELLYLFMRRRRREVGETITAPSTAGRYLQPAKQKPT